MNPFEEIIVIQLYDPKNPEIIECRSYLTRTIRKPYRWQRSKKDRVLWDTVIDVKIAFHFKSIALALHYARTLRIVKRKTKQGYSWRVVKTYIPAAPPSDIIVATSSTDSALHRLARAAE